VLRNNCCTRCTLLATSHRIQTTASWGSGLATRASGGSLVYIAPPGPRGKGPVRSPRAFSPNKVSAHATVTSPGRRGSAHDLVRVAVEACAAMPPMISWMAFVGWGSAAAGKVLKEDKLRSVSGQCRPPGALNPRDHRSSSIVACLPR
jgi:hypothetical protein